VKEQQVGDEILRGVFEVPQTHGDSKDFDNAMAEAEESGVKAHHIELLNRLANGEHSRDIAAAEGVSPRTVRQHRKDAVDEVRRVLLNN
jgi:DNA-binding CsgD family transcriptional regulator